MPSLHTSDNIQLNLYRRLLGAAGTVYFFWWFSVEYFLPGSFNPFLSRIGVVALCLLTLLGSSYWERIRSQVQLWFWGCVAAVTLHYFYLFYGNKSDINWVVGSYITVITVSACLQSPNLLLAYCGLVFCLSVGLTLVDHSLLETIFLPGMMTILIFSYYGLRTRLKLTSQIQQNSQRIQSLFDATFEGIVVHDKGIILDLNESMARILGYKRSEMMAMNVLDFAVQDFKAIIQAQIESQSSTPYEISGIKKDGTQVPLEICGKPHFFEGTLVRITAVRDLTERKKNETNRSLYETTLEALGIRESFISIASHELKTPLTVIKIQTDLAKITLQKELPGASSPKTMEKIIEQVAKQADRLTLLVDSLLNVSRISTGKLELEKHTVNLSAVVSEVMQSLTTSVEKAGCELHLQIAPDLVANVDRLRIEQVVTNLVNNALKYGPGKPIFVKLENRKDEVALSVQDYGIGISESDQERVFGKFERVVSNKTVTGLGLGLYICKQIVEAHGGLIKLSSEIGRGSTFTVMLPT